MKKILLLIFACISLSINFSIAQTMKASLGFGGASNTVKIYITPDATQTPATIATLQFNLAIPTTVTPVPTVTLVTNPSFGATWVVDPAYVEGGFYNYNIYTAVSPLMPNLTAGTEIEVMEVSFDNTFLVNSQNVYLATLPDGGTIHPGFAVFYCDGTIVSDGHSNLYYARGAATVDNQFSYDNPTFAIAGTGTSTATLPEGVLPVKLVNFSAIKKDKDAVLNWQVANQDAISSHFDVQRGFTGTDFKSIGRVDVNLNSGATATYAFNDVNIAAAKSNGVIYYRLKMVDKDAKFTYSPVRSVRLTSKGFGVNLYPNPAKGFSNLSIELSNPSQIVLSITDAAGRIVQNMEFAGFKGLNQKRIDLSKLASGSYMIKVNNGSEVQTVSLIKE